MRRLAGIITIVLITLIHSLGCSKPEDVIKGKFVFTSTRRQGTIGAFLMRDSKITLLGKGLDGPVWSNNGKYIAASDLKNHDSIIIFDEFGKSIETVSIPNVGVDFSWSPDDKKIAYTGIDPKSRSEKSKRLIVKYIYIYDLEKKTNTRVYEGDDSDSVVNLAFSPQGDKLAFRSQRSDDKRGIYIINIDGTNLKRMSTYGRNPSWFPDNKHLMIVMSKDDSGKYINQDGKPSYYKVDSETGEIVEELMHEPVAVGFTPKLSRDGSYIYSDKQIGGGRVIVVIPLFGKYRHQNIPIYPKDQFGYDISPDWWYPA